MAQDVIFYRRLPVSPADFNFSPDSTVLEIWTEFLESGVPTITTTGSDSDQTVDFGVTRFARGNAYVQDSQDLHPVPVEKTWLEIDNKHFLVESISYLQLKPLLDTLQASVTSTNTTQTAKSTFPDRETLVAKVFSQKSKPLLSASIHLSQGPRERGVVADYTTLNSSLTNFVAAAGSTYFITGPVSVNSAGGAPALTIEGGSCLKFTNSLTAGLIVNGPMLCKTGPYRMAILSSWSDDSCGQSISGSTHSPTNYQGANFISGASGTCKYLRFSYAGTGLSGSFDHSDAVWHCQFISCLTGVICDTDLKLHNALFCNCSTAAIITQSSSVLRAENITADQIFRLCQGAHDTTNYGKLTNSILTAVTTLGAIDTLVSCATNSSSAGFYQTAGAGNYYLAPFSTNRGAGTTLINSNLLAAIKQKTSYPPIIYSNITVSTNITLSPQAQRDTGPPDLGFLYDPVDYLTYMFVETNAALTIAPGTAIACYNWTGIWIQEGGSITCIGTPLAPNWLVGYQGVQEQPISLGGSTASWSVNPYHTGTPAPTGTFRFTRFVTAPGGGNQFYNSSWSFGTLLLQDSEVWGGVNKFDGATNTTITLRNNLFNRGSATSYNTTSTNSLSVSNNLFWSVTSLSFHPVNAALWSVFNNEFDSCSLWPLQGTLTSGNNAYWNCNKQLTPTNASDITLSSAIAYQSGPLGDFYQPTNSILANTGSCTADLASLYHFTCTTNIVNGAEVPETNSVVDVGLHYIAVDTNGLPLDFDHGGAPNWIENPSGDGHTNNVAEGNWQNASDDVNYLVQPGYLRCEYRVDPWGVDAKDPISGKQKPRLFWIVTSGHRAAKQLAYQVLVATSTNNLAAAYGDVWDSGQFLSDQTIHVEYNGAALQSGQRLWWKVRSWDRTTGLASPWSTNAFFQMGLLSTNDWTAQWLTTTNDPGTNSPMYRHNFVQRTNDIKRATAYVTAKGLYELWLDGQRIGTNLLAPEWTYYNQRIQYQTFDVTTNLMSASTDGTNHAIGAIVAEGWFSGRETTDEGNPNPYTNSIGGRKQILIQLKIERNDTTITNIVTDSTWTCTISNGPIQGSSIWDGETYAVTNEAKVANWSMPTYPSESTIFTDGVTNYTVDPTVLVAQPSDPIQIIEYLHPIDMWTNTNKFNQFVRIYDMGQNMAGWCSISLVNTNQPAGTRIALRHAETLELDYPANKQLRGTNIDIRSLQTVGTPAVQTDVIYILNTNAPQKFQPHFTYHGFRYVEIAASNNIVLDINSVTGCVIRSSVPVTGAFTCSHKDVNQLMTNIAWTLKANLYGIETDCPQRNERLGWLGDSDAFSQTACFMMDMSAFYTRCIRDIRDGQWPTTYNSHTPPQLYFGAYAFNNPFAGKGQGDIGWEAGGVIKPWQLYQNYSDTRMFTEHYLSASNWIYYLWTNYPANFGQWEIGSGASDGGTFGSVPSGWSSLYAGMHSNVHGWSFYAYSADILANMSKVLQGQALAQGSTSTATTYSNNFTYYTNLAASVRSAFTNSLVTFSGGNITTVGNGTQGDYTYALNFNMVPDSQRSNCMYLMLNTANAGILDYHKSYTNSGSTLPDTNHLSTGIQGTGRAMLELTQNGYNAKAYELLTDYRFPSWLYQITNGGAIYNGTNSYGATTCWEHWDGLVSGTNGGYYSFFPYNSFNHFWAGSVGEWIYRNIGGINPDDSAPGFQNVIIEPQPGGGITNAFASFNSIHGPAVCSWTNNIATTNFSLNVTVPANTTAFVYILGATNLGSITESGVSATNAPGVLYPVTVTNGAALFQVGSGTYRFSAPVRF